MSEPVVDREWRPRSPLGLFLGAAAGVFVLTVLAGVLSAPPAVAVGLSVVAAVFFVGLPILGLFSGSAHGWTAKGALVPLLAGVALHGGAFLTIRSFKLEGLPGLLLQASMQVGVMAWCLGLGALVAILIRERNMLLPVAIFLAGMDAFLILSPLTPQAQIAAENPEVIKNIGYTVPMVRASGPDAPAGVGLQDMVYIGPADLFISAVFFACLFRYGMRARATATWLVPVLVGYLFLVLLTGMPLPALVPIGITVLAVNWREFQLSRDEKQATWLVTVIALGLAGWGVYNRLTYVPPVRESEESGMGARSGPAVSVDGSSPGTPESPESPAAPGR